MVPGFTMLLPDVTVAVNVTTVSAETVTTGLPFAVMDNVVVVVDAAQDLAAPIATMTQAKAVQRSGDEHFNSERTPVFFEDIVTQFLCYKIASIHLL
jgi:hypothetical protein